MSVTVAGPARASKSSNAGRIVLFAIGSLFALNVGFAMLDRWTGGARPGPPSSTYTTAEEGLAGYADLLSRDGRNVTRLREPLADTALDPSWTVVVLDATLPPKDVDALRAFVASGGRLVTGGVLSGWLRGILARPPSWQPAPAGLSTPVAPLPEVSGVASVISSGAGVWSDTGQALPALAGPQGALLAVSTLGPGRIVLLATSAPLQNRLLDDADNAALGLALVGEPERPIVFAEHPHGFGDSQGLRAIPARARWAFGGIALGVIVWMISRARRLGPPEDASRPLPPPRRAYVESLAMTLGKTRRRAEAAAPVYRAARERIARLTGVPPDGDERAWRAAATRLGLTESEVDALLHPRPDDRTVVEIGRAFARLESMKP